MRRITNPGSCLIVKFAILVVILGGFNGAYSSTVTKGVYNNYVKNKDHHNAAQNSFSSAPSSSPVQNMNGAASTLSASPSFYEPRGDYAGGGGGGYGGGGYGGGGGGGGGYGGGGGWGGGPASVYHYSLHQQQPYYHPAPMYYDEGFDGSEKGLIGLLGLTGLKGLLGLAALLKLLLPLLLLLVPLLLPLLLLKALAILALILLIPVPVISTGAAGRKLPHTIEEGKAYIKDTVAELLSKIPSDLNQIISKIKDSSVTSELLKPKESKERAVKQKLSDKVIAEKSS